MKPAKKLLMSLICLLAMGASGQSSMPASTRERILSNEVVTAFSANDHQGVLRSIDQAKSKGTTIPVPLLELEARSAYAVRDTSRALKALEEYLSKGDQSSKSYQDAVNAYASYKRGVQDSKDWNEARSKATQESLMSYHDKWPKGLYARDITKTAEELEGRAWREALGKKAGWALDRYSRAWPDGPHQADLARERPVLDEAAWLEANRINTDEAYDAYVENWPTGKYYAQAQLLSDDLHWRRIEHSQDKYAVGAYINRKGSKRHLEQARTKLAALNSEDEQEVIRIANQVLGSWKMVQVEQDSDPECGPKEITSTTINFQRIDTTSRSVVGDAKRSTVTDWKKGYSCPDDETIEATFGVLIKFDRVQLHSDVPELSAETTQIGCSGSKHDSGCRFGSFTLSLSPAGALSYREFSDDRAIPLKKAD